MLTLKEAKALDLNAQALGATAEQMMEAAGKAVADAALAEFPKAKKILVFCGAGNNGGDGFVAARYLKEAGKKVEAVLAQLPEEIRTAESRRNFKKMYGTGVKFSVFSGRWSDSQTLRLQDSKTQDLIIDALLGFGASGELKEPYKSCVAAINKSGAPVIAVDVPTGLGTAGAIKPKVTVTFHDEKEGMKGKSGKIIISDIGVPSEARDFVGAGDLKVFYPIPRQDSHKGDNGVVLVVGGGPYTGAPALAGMAAYRTGADIVYLAVPERIWQVVAGYSPNFIVHPLSGDAIRPEHVSEILALSRKCTAVVIGNGAGGDEKTIDALAESLLKIEMPVVVDANGITALKLLSERTKNEERGIKNKTIVATPHAGEFERLTGEALPADMAVRAKTVKNWAGKLGITLLVKGQIDIISDGTRVKLNKIHNAGMTVGGTGDVLAGIAGELLAKGVEPFYAAALAAYTNGSAGNLAFEEKWYSLLATDVVEKIPEALRNALEQAPEFERMQFKIAQSE